MAKILIVDDEPDIYELVRRYAEHEGHETTEASDGVEAVRLCREQEFDIIIMDVMMPDMDGFTACRQIRKVKDIPVLILSARGAEYDKLFGFELGIDDYMVKPFSPRELMARVNVIVNRRRQSQRLIKLGKLCIDHPGRNVYVHGVKTDLTPKEYCCITWPKTGELF